MPIIVGIDGTGGGVLPSKLNPWRDEGYDKEMATSFVRTLSNTGKLNHKYFRGPASLGGGLIDAIVGGYDFITKRRMMQPNEPVLLTGYSRGAAGVVALAQKLDKIAVVVQAMMLFDCVDRHAGIDASTIPGNVRNVMHARRDPSAGSRETFGNAGTKCAGPSTKYEEHYFYCTHGGVGGTPWTPGDGQKLTDFIYEGVVTEGLPGAVGFEGAVDGSTNVTFQLEATMAKFVWEKMQPFLRKHGFIGSNAING